jgi:hypothetical protein
MRHNQSIVVQLLVLLVELRVAVLARLSIHFPMVICQTMAVPMLHFLVRWVEWLVADQHHRRSRRQNLVVRPVLHLVFLAQQCTP